MNGLLAPGQTHLNRYMQESALKLRWGYGKSPEVFCGVEGSGRWPTHRSQSRRLWTQGCAPVHRSFIAMSGRSLRLVQISDELAVDRASNKFRGSVPANGLLVSDVSGLMTNRQTAFPAATLLETCFGLLPLTEDTGNSFAKLLLSRMRIDRVLEPFFRHKFVS